MTFLQRPASTRAGSAGPPLFADLCSPCALPLILFREQSPMSLHLGKLSKGVFPSESPVLHQTREAALQDMNDKENCYMPFLLHFNGDCRA